MKSNKQLLRIGNKIILEKKLGNSGAYGIVYKSYYRSNKNDDYKENIKFAVKICEMNDLNYKEISISQTLTDYAINYNYISFPILYGYLECDNAELNDFYSSEATSGSLVYSHSSFDSNYNSLLKNDKLYFQIYEIANGNVNNYFAYIIDNKTNKFKSNELVFNALSQIFISVMYFQDVMNMQHNDTHFGNFLFHKVSRKEYDNFTFTILDKNLLVKNIGYLWIINDFGLATQLYKSKIVSQVIKDYIMILEELMRYKAYFIDDTLIKFIMELKKYLKPDLYDNDNIDTIKIKIINCLFKYTNTIILEESQ